MLFSSLFGRYSSADFHFVLNHIEHNVFMYCRILLHIKVNELYTLQISLYLTPLHSLFVQNGDT